MNAPGLVLALLVASTAFAQPGDWRELNRQTKELIEQGRFAQAVPAAQAALAAAERALGPQHADTAACLNNLGLALLKTGRFSEAESAYRRALAIIEKALGPADASVGVTLGNLGLLYHEQGQYQKARAVLLQSLKIILDSRGPALAMAIRPLTTLGAAYAAGGHYREAEAAYSRALKIAETVWGTEHLEVARCLVLMADLVALQGRVGEATKLNDRARAIREKTLGPASADTAITVNNQGSLLLLQGRTEEAMPYLREALATLEKQLGPEHPRLVPPLMNLAEACRDTGAYDESLRLSRRALQILERTVGPEHPSSASLFSNLGLLQTERLKFGEAESLFKRSLAALIKALGPDHPMVGTVSGNLARLYFLWRRSDLAGSYYQQSLRNRARQVEYHFTYMTESDRLAFMRTVEGALPEYFSYCLAFRQKNPVLLGDMYDVLLWRKGLVAVSVAAVRARIQSSADPKDLALLEELTAKRTRLAQMLLTPPDDWTSAKSAAEALEQEANALEGKLARKFSGVAEERRLARVTWQDVRAALRAGDAAVEFARFEHHEWGIPTGSVRYVALVLTPESRDGPTLVELGDSEELERRGFAEYRRQALSRGLAHEEGAEPDRAPLSELWRRLEPTLGGARRVFLAPDGLLHHVSWAVLPVADGQLLVDAYDVRLVSSSRDLTRPQASPGTRSAILLGDPLFKLGETGAAATASNRYVASDPGAGSAASRDLRGLKAPPLPSTKVEVEQIARLLGARGWQVRLYTGEGAAEHSLKAVHAPRVLHVATHGFFLPDLERLREDPMLRSGLLLAGANRTLAGQASPADRDDGVLTAYEAAGLDLRGTELVVLSACETGLGEVRNAEGVFGLPRALQIAGAENVLMSLWAVPDRETQELMALFYERWLAGRGFHEALREAQRAMRVTVRARYGADLPFYWGAFVLVGR